MTNRSADAALYDRMKNLCAQLVNVRAAFFYYSSERGVVVRGELGEVEKLLRRLRVAHLNLDLSYTLKRRIPDELDGVGEGLGKLGNLLRSLMGGSRMRMVAQLVYEFVC